MSNPQNINVNVMELLNYVDRLNSGHDRDVVFAYVEEFLKKEKKIKVDLEKSLRKWQGIDD